MNVTYLCAGALAMVSAAFIGVLNAEFHAADPGVRGAAGARFAASEANGVVDRFNQLSERQTQDVFNFLRSL